MVALERLVCAEESWARAWVTCAWAARTPAMARRFSARAASSSVSRRHPAVGDAEDLLLAGEVGAGLGGRSLGGGDLRLGGREAGLGLDDRVLQPRRVEPGKRLAGGDAVVVVDEDLGHQARLLGADLDLVGRLEVAGRGDGDGEVAAPHRLGRIAARRRRRRSSATAAAGRTSTTMPATIERPFVPGLAPPARRGSPRASPCRRVVVVAAGALVTVWS